MYKKQLILKILFADLLRHDVIIKVVDTASVRSGPQRLSDTLYVGRSRGQHRDRPAFVTLEVE